MQQRESKGGGEKKNRKENGIPEHDEMKQNNPLQS